MGQLLVGKICLVTGTSRGLGRAIAELFCKEGAVVYASARNEACLDRWTEEISLAGTGKLLPIYFNLRDLQADRAAVAKIRKEQGRLDVLVNNAGVSRNELIGMVRENSLREIFETNVFGPMELLQSAARVMQRQKSGSIINISSIIGVEGGRGELAYAASKGAVISMTKSASKELAPYHIRVNSVAPGYADTDMFHNAAGSQENEEKHLAKIGFGRLASPEDIAQACLFFASDVSSYVTGQILGVNGSTVI